MKNQHLSAEKTFDLLSELSFHEELNVMEIHRAFRRYAMSYKIELDEKKEPIKQLEASKSSIKDLLNDLSNDLPNNTKSYVKKYKPNEEIEFRLVYFNSTIK